MYIYVNMSKQNTGTGWFKLTSPNFPRYMFTGFTKLHMVFVVLVNTISVLITFLLQDTNLVSVLSKICPNFAGNV